MREAIEKGLVRSMEVNLPVDNSMAWFVTVLEDLALRANRHSREAIEMNAMINTVSNTATSAVSVVIIGT